MIGQVVGNYKVVERIGEGGMGTVFKAIDFMLDREVAIKVLRPELAWQSDVIERFRTEAAVLAKLNHPNIATVYSLLRDGNALFLVMEYVKGETLDAAIMRGGPVFCDRAVGLFSEILDAVHHAHKLGIIHRDIKPSNIMVTDTDSIKVMDFGIARILGGARLTKTGGMIGTLPYMSPEQIQGQAVDPRADIYSLGVLLYEILTGRLPFQADNDYALMRSHIEEEPVSPRVHASYISVALV